MVPIKFASSVLGLLFVLHTLRDSSAHAHQGGGLNGNRLLMATRDNVAYIHKELLEGISAAASRKMVAAKVLKKEIKKVEELDEETSKISGKDLNASNKSLGRLQDHMNNQDNSNMLEPKTLEYAASMGISGSTETVHLHTNLNYSQDSKAVSTKASSRSNEQMSPEPHDDISHKDESQKVLLDQAADEIVNLMNKDYRGDKAHRKPPINNDKPTD